MEWKRTVKFEDQSSLPGPPLKMSANPSPEVKAIKTLTPDLTTALSNELLSRELISDEVYSKVLESNHSATEKAAIMINSARKVIELAPSKFTEFLEVLSKLNCARLVESLNSTCQSKATSYILQGSHQFMPSSSERSLAHHGMGMAAIATGVQPTPQSIRFSQPSVDVTHSQMDAMQLPNVHPQQQAHMTPPHHTQTTTSMHSSSQMHEGEMIHWLHVIGGGCSCNVYRSQVTWQVSASDTCVVQCLLTSQFLEFVYPSRVLRECVLMHLRARKGTCEYLRLNGKSRTSLKASYTFTASLALWKVPRCVKVLTITLASIQDWTWKNAVI